jgi:hypothetical protein
MLSFYFGSVSNETDQKKFVKDTKKWSTFDQLSFKNDEFNWDDYFAPVTLNPRLI